MKRAPLIFLIGIFIITAFSNCYLFKRGEHNTKEENFDQFYDRFHKDMDFQRSRVKFPLNGMMVDGDKETLWTPENFPLMKVRIYDIDEKTYNVSYQLSDKTFVQKVSLKNSGLFAEYRFERIKNKWYLVYVMDQNL